MPVILFLVYTQNKYSSKYLYMNVQSSTIHDSQKVETQMSINR